VTRHASLRLPLAAPFLALGLLACVTQERQQVAAAEQAYEQCAAEHFASHPDCVALHERLLTAQRRYEESSRRAWSCDPAQEQCPTPR